MRRLQELRNHESEVVSVDSNSNACERSTAGYITVLFSDIVLYCSEKILALRGTHTNMYRLDQWSTLDAKGRFIIDRPSKYFKALYDYLQIGAVSVHISDYPILLSEARFYGILEVVPGSSVSEEERAIKKVVGDYVTLFSPEMVNQCTSLFHSI